MHKSMIAFLLALLLASCTQEPPKCSDVATIDLVKDIVLNKIGVDAASREKIGTKLLASILTLENARPSAYDEKIKKFSCEGTLVAKSNDSDGNFYSLPIRFESQLDDRNDHIVAVKDLLIADLHQIDLYLAFAIEKEKTGNQKAAPQPVAVAEPVEKQIVSEVVDESASASTSEVSATVEQSGACKGLDLAVTFDQSECVTRKRGIADQKLNEEYKRVMASLSPFRQLDLQARQLAWTKQKEQSCASAGKDVEGGSLEPIAIANCETRMTEERTEFLASYK